MGPWYADRSARTISISQGAFIDSILTRFNHTNAAPVKTPVATGTHLSADDWPTSKDEMEMAMGLYRELVGDVAWLALGTRSDIRVHRQFSRALRPQPRTRVHWEAAKMVLRHLKGTKGWRLTLGGKRC
jgi:uncharacterized membrane protein